MNDDSLNQQAAIMPSSGQHVPATSIRVCLHVVCSARHQTSGQGRLLEACRDLTAWLQVLRLLALAYTEEGSQPQLALNCVHKLRSEGGEGIERCRYSVSLDPCQKATVAASLLAC